MTEHAEGATATHVGVAVVEWQGRFLVGRRTGDGPLAGFDEFPGGKCTLGESHAHAAIRECLEETGLEVFAVDLLMRRTFQYPHGLIDLEFWLCRPTPKIQDRIPDSCQGYRWVARAELASLHFPPANAPLLERLLHGESPPKP